MKWAIWLELVDKIIVIYDKIILLPNIIQTIWLSSICGEW